MYSTNTFFTFITSLILLFCGVVTMQEAQAQCNTQITSVTPAVTICPNDTFTFTGVGQGVATSFNFNGATFPTGWVASAFTLGQPCDTPSPDGTDYFWSSAGGFGVARFVRTSVIDASPGGNLIFEIDFGNDDPDPGCEEVDANEGVFLQYSINGGTSWVDIQYFDPTDPSGGAIGYDWVLQNIPIPLAAQTASTMFRWIQPNHSGTGYDNWGLDNISVTQTVPVIAQSWDFGDGSPLDTSGGTVSHVYAATGTYTVTYETTVFGGCTSSTTVLVTVSPAARDIDVLGNNVSISNGDDTPDTSDNTDFGTVCSPTVTRTFTIQNVGVETLNLTGSPLVAVSGSVDFSISQPTTNTIAAGSNLTFQVIYTPNLLGTQTATVSIANNSCNENPYTFDVSAISDATPPVIVVPANITVPTDAGICGAVVSYADVTATDNCSGSSSLSEVLANFNTNFATTTALIPSPYSFSDGVTGTNIIDGGNDMYDGGNQLNTNLGNLIPYSDNTIVTSTNFGTTGSYFTRKVNNMFIMAADLDGVTTFFTTGNNGADGSGTAFGTDFTVNSNGTEYRVFYKRVCGAGDPSINQLMIIPNNPSVTQSISTDTNNGLQSITDISSAGRIYYILFATQSGGCETTATATAIAQSFLDENVSGGLTIVQTAGLASGSTFPVGTTTNTFTATDPVGNTATQSFTVTVMGSEIDVLGNGISIVDGDITPSVADNTDFGNVATSSTKTYTITNTGTDAITISSITSNNGNFVITNAPTTVAAGGTETFNVVFTPTISTTQTATITINNNDCNEGIYDFLVQGQRIVIISNPLPAPRRVRNFIATAVSTTQINLTWEPVTMTSNVTSYNLYQDGVLIANLPISTRNYEVTGLTPDTFYAFSLVSENRRPAEVRLSSPVADNARTFPEAPVLLSQTNVCGSGNSAVKVSSTGAIYRVYPDSIGNTILVEGNNATITFPRVSETTTFYVSVVSHDQESARTAVTVVVEPTFQAIILGGSNQVSCESTLFLTVDSVENATYTWFRNGLAIGMGESFEATSSGTYQVRISKGACNIFSEAVNVKVNFAPIADIQQLNGVRFCDAGTLNAIQTNNDATYEWILNGATVGQGASISVSESGVYTLQVTQHECQASTEIDVVVAPMPQIPTLEATKSIICPDTETVISIQNPENGVTYQWFRNRKSLRQTGTSISTSVRGYYQVRAISTQNTACNSFSEELLINRFEVLPIYLRVNEDKTSLFVEDANLSQNEIATVEWYFEGELNANLGTTFEITPTENGYYSARVTNLNGCVIQTRTVYFTVPEVVTGEEDVIITNVFKIYPNPSTGAFKIQFPIVLTENIQMTVFDALGRVIHTQQLEKGNQGFSVNIEGISKGMYMIHFNQNGSTYSKQIIIE